MSWPFSDFCRPSRLAEFVNGKGSFEKFMEEQFGTNGASCNQFGIPGQGEASSHFAPPPPAGGTQIIVLPLAYPRSSPSQTNAFTGMDSLGDFIPEFSQKCCCCKCQSESQSFDCRGYSSDKKIRVSFQQNSSSRGCSATPNWPNFPLPAPPRQ